MFIIDGYKFRGREPFKRAKEGLQNMMIRGSQGEVGGLEYKVLDTRDKGVEREIDVQVSENAKKGVDNRGVAVLKLYGPNKRKENSVLVTKYKESDIKFVSILAEKVVKPLIRSILAVDDKSQESKIVKGVKCEICDNTFQTMRGLKGHKTKVHRGETVENQDINTEILWSDENEIDEESICENISEEIEEENRYFSTCKQCGLYMEAQKKYLLIKQIKQHRNLKCQNKNLRVKVCDDCDYQAKSEILFKRHRRDKHEQLSASTSPPPKKAKITKPSKLEEKMEVDEISIDMDDKTTDYEDMEVDCADKEKLIRSKRMDEKIIAKIKEQEEKERKYKEGKAVKELEKKRKNENEQQEIKQNDKKRKQKAKDAKKKLRKKNSQRDTFKVNMVKIPNLKPVPSNCAHLVNEGDLVYIVPGNGACGPNAISAHLFKDDVFGPKLKRRMNQFFAKHWEKKYKFITGCSKESPFERKLPGGGKVSFTDPKKLVEYLEKSVEAEYMWTDSEDLAVVSDMYQVNIKVITSKGEKDTKPTVNWIFPDESLKEFAELKDVELEDIVLMHEADSHFNLIVSEQSELATLGSLSFRSNIGPFEEVKNFEDDTMEELEPGTSSQNTKEMKKI